MMPRLGVLAFMLATTLVAGQAHAQSESGDCRQPASGERRFRLVFDDRGVETAGANGRKLGGITDQYRLPFRVLDLE